MSDAMMCTRCKEFYHLDDRWNYCPCCGNEKFTEQWELDKDGRVID